MLSIHSSPIGKLGTNDTGGMSVFIHETAKQLAARGHSVDIFTRKTDANTPEILHLHHGVRLIHLDGGRKGYMSKLATYPHLENIFQELDKFKKREQLDYHLIHSHYWLSGIVGLYAQNQWGVPNVITFHTLGAVKNNTEGVEREPQIRVDEERKLTNSCRRILAGTEQEKKQLIQYYGASPEAVGVVPCGVDLDLFKPGRKKVSKKILGLNQNEPYILYVGRFSPSKGLDRLIEAIGLLRKAVRYKCLVIGGDGQDSPEVNELKSLSSMLDVQEQVSFIGRLDQKLLPTYYNAASILVMPSRYESFGMVALESMACGTPVVATKVGALEQIIGHGGTGYLVLNNSPHAIAEGIETFMPRAKQLNAEVLRSSVLKFQWVNIAEMLVREYENAREPLLA